MGGSLGLLVLPAISRLDLSRRLEKAQVHLAQDPLALPTAAAAARARACRATRAVAAVGAVNGGVHVDRQRGVAGGAGGACLGSEGLDVVLHALLAEAVAARRRHRRHGVLVAQPAHATAGWGGRGVGLDAPRRVKHEVWVVDGLAEAGEQVEECTRCLLLPS